MVKKTLAIANCRVSSDEQLLNNSLSRQKEAVLKAADELGVTIPHDGWWSGSVSSKKGTNINRKDLKEMIERCKKDKRIKYLIVDEPDRFMRSIDEAAYFEVTFRQLGVTVWYACDSDLNKGDLGAKLLKFTKYLSAEGSNDSRQTASIGGQSDALKMGRYTFHPKPGYMRGPESGVHILHPERGPALRRTLKKLAARLTTPTEALIELNNSEFTNHHSPYKMDRFKDIAVDPYYAGIVMIDKQIKVRNESGLHEPLISLEERERIIQVMSKRPVYQTGPNPNGNPEFPMNKLLIDDQCINEKNGGKAVGFNHGNGKSTTLVYKKYRCRTCNRYWHRSEIHEQVVDLFDRYELSQERSKELINALEVVWKQNQQQTEQEIARLRHTMNSLKEVIRQKVIDATDPSNQSIKQDIMNLIDDKKTELEKLENKLGELISSNEEDKKEFMEFALNFIEDTGRHFLEEYVSKENRLRCKQLIFPGGIMINQKNKVYTREVSIFYRLAAKEKGAKAPSNTQMVRVRGL